MCLVFAAFELVRLCNCWKGAVTITALQMIITALLVSAKVRTWLVVVIVVWFWVVVVVITAVIVTVTIAIVVTIVVAVIWLFKERRWRSFVVEFRNLVIKLGFSMFHVVFEFSVLRWLLVRRNGLFVCKSYYFIHSCIVDGVVVSRCVSSIVTFGRIMNVGSLSIIMGSLSIHSCNASLHSCNISGGIRRSVV